MHALSVNSHTTEDCDCDAKTEKIKIRTTMGSIIVIQSTIKPTMGKVNCLIKASLEKI